MSENINYRAKIEAIRQTYLKGLINHDQAKDQVEALLPEMNEKGKVIAKKFGKRFTKLTFGYVFR